MNRQEYWAERARQNELRVFRYAEKRARLVTRWFIRAEKEMQKRISGFYRQYSGDGANLREAKRTLTDKRAISLSLEQAQRLAKRCPDDPELAQLLRRLYLQRAVSREEFLQMQLQLLASELYGQYAGETGRSLTEIFEDSYYHTLYDFQQFTGFGLAFNRLNTHQIEAAVNTAWSGKNYSERIWGGQRKTLARYLNRIVTTGVIQGKPAGEMSAQLKKAMDTGSYEARRLIRTECTAVAGKANLAGYRENGTQQFQILATLDNRTSEICRSMDGKIFETKEGRIGVNIPPLHPFCRSTTIPYLPDAGLDGEDTRAARSGSGETYRVPAHMAYREWYGKYVASSPEELLAEHKVKNGPADAKQYQRYAELLGWDAPKSLDRFQRIKYTEAERYQFIELDFRRRSRLKSHLDLTLPNAGQATAAEAKFTGYLFSGDNRKGLAKGAAISRRLGYSLSNWEQFQQEILRKASLYPAINKGEDRYGETYEQKMVINGLLHTPANVVVGWKVKEGRTWMTSAYIKEVKGG